MSQQELLRYSRHLILPEVGLAGQRRLKAGSVLLIGAGQILAILFGVVFGIFAAWKARTAISVSTS